MSQPSRPMLGHIGRRIIAVVGIVVTIALLALTILSIQRQEESILAQNERTLVTVTQSIIQGIKTVMLAGHADIGEELAQRVRQVAEVVDLRTLRADGTEAFRDNATLRAVNEQLGGEVFPLRASPEAVQVLPATDPRLRQVVMSGDVATYYHKGTNGDSLLTLLAPITSQQECAACHAGDEDGSVRGVIKLTTSLAAVQADIGETWTVAILALLATLAAIMLFVHAVVAKTIVEPIDAATRAMMRAADGDLDQKVPTVAADEFGRMAASFNHMIEELRRIYSGLRYEKNKLTTIILGAREGMVVTDPERRVVLVNPAAEELLGKSADRIREDGFENLFGDPDRMRQRLQVRDADSPPEIISFNGRILSVHVATIRSDQELVGSAALLRDISEEWRLQKELERLSITDALTGLHNRRHFDAKLASEFAIAGRYSRPVSLLLFDVDRFKHFNDTYGHDTGDRVLQGIAAIAADQSRSVDVACRYGGEEFVIILPNTRCEDATNVAERLRAAVEASRIEGHTVTVSIGVSTYPDIPAREPEELLKAADEALYRAKRGGRNRVIVAEPCEPAGS